MEIKTKLSNRANYGGKRTSPIAYIVIHYTANLGDTAKNNADYFAREVVKASAHYFVDESEVWQSVPDDRIAWHCGGGLQGAGGHTYYGKCKNANSLGVEICMLDKLGRLRQGSIDNAAKLVRELMRKYGVPADRVIRHYDVTGKNCPAPMVSNMTLWRKFKDSLKEDDDMIVYKKPADVPAWGRPTVDKLIRHGSIKPDPDGSVNLSSDLLRMLVINDREGLYK